MASMPQSTAPASGRRRFALLLEYDGSCYAGSQLQPDAPTVQGVLEAAVEQTTGQTVRVAFAGRTDAGVHARGQVASFVCESRLDIGTMQRALNAWLPEEVVVRQIAEVDEAFDARRDAVRRHYRYVIDNGPVRPVTDRHQVWHVAGKLDITAMTEAAQSILGTHDFAAFASRFDNPDLSTVRNLSRFDVCRSSDSIFVDVEGNAFLPHQVRRMTGALVEVGRGKLSVEDYKDLLAGDPATAGPVAPPHGLSLMSVKYPVDPFSGHDASPALGRQED
jgi:tRNA pseudouridine38-40 synthase